MLLKGLLLWHVVVVFCSAYDLNGLISDSDLPNLNENLDGDNIAVSSTTRGVIRGRRGRPMRRHQLPVYHSESPLSDEIMENFEMLRRNDKSKRKYVVEVPVPAPSEDDNKASLSEIHYSQRSSDAPTSTFIPDIHFFQYEDIQQLVNKKAQNAVEAKPENNQEEKKTIEYRPKYKLENVDHNEQSWESGKAADNINKQNKLETHHSTTMQSVTGVDNYKAEEAVQLEEGYNQKIKSKTPNSYYDYQKYQDGYDTPKFYYTRSRKPTSNSQNVYTNEDLGTNYLDDDSAVSKQPEISDQPAKQRKPQRQQYRNVQKHTNVMQDNTINQKQKNEFLDEYSNDEQQNKGDYSTQQNLRFKFIKDISPEQKNQNNFRIVIDNNTKNHNEEDAHEYRYKPLSEEKIVEYVKTHYPKDKLAQSVIVISNNEDKFINHYKPTKKQYNRKVSQEHRANSIQDSEANESSIREEKQYAKQVTESSESYGITVEPYSTRGQVQDVGKKIKVVKEQLRQLQEQERENSEIVHIGKDKTQNKPTQSYQLQNLPYEILKDKTPNKQDPSYQLQEYAYDVRDQNYEIRIKPSSSKGKNQEEDNVQANKNEMNEDENKVFGKQQHEIKKLRQHQSSTQKIENLKQSEQSEGVSYEKIESGNQGKHLKQAEQDLTVVTRLPTGLGGYWSDIGPLKIQTPLPDKQQSDDNTAKNLQEKQKYSEQQILIKQQNSKPTNEIPEQLIIYKIQQSKPDLQFPELNVVYNPNVTPKIKLQPLKTINIEENINLQPKLKDQSKPDLQLPELNVGYNPNITPNNKLQPLNTLNIEEDINLKSKLKDQQTVYLPQNNLKLKLAPIDLSNIIFRQQMKPIIKYTEADSIYNSDQKEKMTRIKQKEKEDEYNEIKPEIKYPDTDFMYKFKPNKEEKKIIDELEIKAKKPDMLLYKQPNHSKKTINDYVVQSTTKTQLSDYIVPSKVHPHLLNMKHSSSHYEPSDKVKRGPYKLIFPSKT